MRSGEDGPMTDEDSEGFLRVTLVVEEDSIDPLSLPGGLRGQVLAGRYRLGGLVGRGGASEVYSAEDLADGGACAVKVMLPHVAAEPEHARRFEREARAAALLVHPNVMRVLCLAVDPTRDLYFIVMELGIGRSLASTASRHAGTLPLAFVGDVLGALLDVVAFAHARGVLHRDLKPENVLLVAGPAGRYTPKVLDFGLVRIISDASSRSVTEPSMIRGTPAYMSPEQCRSLLDAGPESDVYALGCMAFELLAGHVPFDAPSAMETLARQLFAAVPPLVRPSGAEPLPEELRALVAAMMAKAPTDRPTAAEAAKRLRDALTTAGVPLGRFELPVSAPVTPPRAGHAADPPPASLTGKRVALLRLDAGRAVVDAVVDGLRARGAKVEELARQAVAVTAAGALVIDAGADVAEGLALASRVRRARPAIKIVVVTSAGAGAPLPGVILLRAPVTLDALVEALSHRRE